MKGGGGVDSASVIPLLLDPIGVKEIFYFLSYLIIYIKTSIYIGRKTFCIISKSSMNVY